MINLTIKAFDGQSYELTSRSGKPKSSAAQLYRNDPYLTQRFVARLPIEPRVWLQILQRSSHSPIAYSSNHPAEIHQAVAKSIMRGDLKLYKLPRLDAVRSIRGKQDMGLCIIQGPHPHSASNQNPVSLNSPQAARELLNELGIEPQTLLAYLEHQKLYTSDSKGSSLDKVLNQLAKGELLAYKIPMPPMAPPAKKLEMIEATGPAYEPVPFGPETSSSNTPASQPAQPQNKSQPESSSANLAANPAPANTTSGVSHPNMPQIKAIMRQSPTLLKNISTLTQHGWVMEYGPPGGGSYADRNSLPRRIVIDQSELERPTVFVQTLAHETGHALYSPDPYTHPQGLTKEQYVNANAASALKDEGEATLMNMEIRNEILQNGGPDIGIAGTQGPSYQKIFTDYKAHGDREVAREDIGFIFANNERPSTDPSKTYKQYYSKPFEDYWDSSQK